MNSKSDKIQDLEYHELSAQQKASLAPKLDKITLTDDEKHPVNNFIYKELFQVSTIDKDLKKFQRVTRFYFKHQKVEDYQITIDIASDLYSPEMNSLVDVYMAFSLKDTWAGPRDHEKNDDQSWKDEESKVINRFDYIMHGKCYKFQPSDNDTVSTYFSFGGLLMEIKGPFEKLTQFRIGEYVYLLIRKHNPSLIQTETLEEADAEKERDYALKFNKYKVKN